MTISMPARSQNLQTMMASILNGYNDVQKANMLKIMLQFENQAFASASSSQEYITLLKARIDELEQGLKTLASNQAASTVAAPTNNQQPAAGSMPMLNTPQFAQQPQNPALSMLAQQQQQQQQPQPQQQLAHTPGSVASTAGPANTQQPNNMNTVIPKLREILQFPENHTMQELHMAFQVLQPQINQSPNKQ
ncbi:hypothetical protein LPJ53_006135, partial [Coemansia erecta]